jgi:FixJ family two-component response regulator
MATPIISVIDDDQSVRESLSSLFRSVGLAVRLYGSAEEFTSSEGVGEEDCVILDVRMPGMSGLELQRVLTQTHPRLPVVFITAHGSDDEVRARALNDGAVAYLSKPLSEETVLEAVQTSLARRTDR